MHWDCIDEDGAHEGSCKVVMCNAVVQRTAQKPDTL